jgi:DnaK suppressor protein
VSRIRQDVRPGERNDVLREMLQDRRREIQENLRSVLEKLPEETAVVREAEEQSVRDFARDVDLALMQMQSDTLAKIDEALRRLEKGGYGRCADCGEEIPPSRLTALPFADRCRTCQEKQETAQGAGPRAGAEVGARLLDALALTPDHEANHE